MKLLSLLKKGYSMPTLLLKMNAPLQAWGTGLKLKNHNTDLYPSKSGVIGMIASAFGRRRNEDISDLAVLKFGVRIDCQGTIIDDFQVSEVPGKEKKIGHRTYLSDACFTCGIEGDAGLICEIEEALKHPANALFLGRRGCPVTAELVQNISELPLENALEEYDKSSGHRVIIIETDDTSCEAVRDVPVSFGLKERVYKYRFIREL